MVARKAVGTSTGQRDLGARFERFFERSFMFLFPSSRVHGQSKQRLVTIKPETVNSASTLVKHS